MYRIILKALLTRGRVAAIALAGLFLIGIGAALGVQDVTDRSESTFGLMRDLGLALVVPIPTLVFASAALGDLIDDGTLVYLWLKPVGRWRIVLAAFAATLTICLPLTVGPMTLATILAKGEASLVVGAAVSAAMASTAYAALFLGFGLLVTRALAWGIGYVIAWEGFVASLAPGPARASIRLYAVSILSSYDGRPVGPLGVSLLTAFLVLASVVLVACALTTLKLSHQNVP